MSYERRAYDDPDSAAQMSADCAACSTQLRIPETRPAGDALSPPPPMRHADLPRDQRLPEIAVSAAAVHLASALHLHLD